MENYFDDDYFNKLQKECNDAKAKHKYYQDYLDTYYNEPIEDHEPGPNLSDYEQNEFNEITYRAIYNFKKDAIKKYKQNYNYYNEYCLSSEKNYKHFVHRQQTAGKDYINVKNNNFDGIDYTKEITEIVELIKDDKVNTVGIFGEWGTGKSFLLQFIKKELSRYKNIIVVDIKATEYDDNEKIWTYIFTEMEKAAKNKSKLLRVLYFVYMSIIFWAKRLLYIALHSIPYILLLFLMGKLHLFSMVSRLVGIDISNENISSTIFILVGTIFIYKFIVPVIDQVTALSESEKKYFGFRKFDFFNKLGYKIDIKNGIDNIQKFWKRYNFVFIVDELDRCNKESIIAFFESVQLIDAIDKIHIIYAIDEEIVLDAISEAGFRKPANYLKKYVDKRIYLQSINSKKDYQKTLAAPYQFFDNEIDTISDTIDSIDVNISIREYFHILNTLSILREEWINNEVKEKWGMSENFYVKEALDWEIFLKVAIYYIIGSVWPQKIYNDFHNSTDQYNIVKFLTNSSDYKEDYSKCPVLLKEMLLINVLNAVRFLNKCTVTPFVNIKDN